MQRHVAARHDNKRSPSDQCFTQRDQHNFYFDGLVLDPAQHLATSRPVHDHGLDRVHWFSRRLHRVSLGGGREILRLQRIDRLDLFSNPDHARLTRVHHAAAGDRYPRAGFSAALGQTSPPRPLDDADLALRFGDRRARLFHALSLVPAAIRPVQLELLHLASS
jgi:hypothetical protein